MGALPHCAPVSPGLLLATHITIKVTQHHSVGVGKSRSSPLPRKSSIQLAINTEPPRRGTTAGAPLGRRLSPSISPPPAERASQPSGRGRAEETQLHRAGSEHSGPSSGSGAARPAHPPCRGGPGRGQRQLSRLWAPCATPAPPRPPPAAPGVPEGLCPRPASPRPAPAPRPPRPYLEGAPERVEGTVQQQGGPAAAEQPQQLPEQHPSWAGGRGRGLRATWGGSRASRLQRRWLAPIPGARLSQL